MKNILKRVFMSPPWDKLDWWFYSSWFLIIFFIWELLSLYADLFRKN